MSTAFTSDIRAGVPSFRVLGVRVNAVQIPDAISVMENWIREGEGSHFVAVTGMHGVMEAQHSPAFKAILSEAGLVVPDGMPLVWLGRRQGFSMRRRVYGPELMETFCKTTASRYRHFFYGGAPHVPELLADTLQQRYGIQVAGTYSPPFHPLTPEEEREVVQMIRAASPDVLWVGLSTPKQEKWMLAFRDRVNVPVMVGVGAAFDFATGKAKQAPPWMREHGLEWLFRLLTEPRRLWRRYLVHGSKFVWNVNLEILKIKKFN
ncbi:MAG TPA: WecB/TagA/CpsF family glycosyltransferase [Terriglobia bacterium]|nr:WecB/TagA/CpsF family glycosyltransferase [Terriglobia bacterium]